MKKIEFSYPSTSNQCDIRAVKWLPDKKPVAILQIAHGMTEFIDRYEEFASFLCGKGFLVTGNDHLGHGGSVKSQNDWGYFAKKNGNEYVLNDIHELTKITKQEYSDLPYFLLGHSMGSFYARQYIGTYGEEVDAAVIMGTGHEPKIVVKAGMAMCAVIALFKGWKYRSKFIDNMVMGAYNKKFAPNRTRADWLTRNESVVDKYVNEPRCSFVFTLNAYYNMFKGISRLHDKNLLANIPKDLPILFVSGKDDPVGSCGKEVKAAYESLLNAGVKDIGMKLYPDDRHEILNEFDKNDVYDDIYNWLEAKIRN